MRYNCYQYQKGTHQTLFSVNEVFYSLPFCCMFFKTAYFPRKLHTILKLLLLHAWTHASVKTCDLWPCWHWNHKLQILIPYYVHLMFTRGMAIYLHPIKQPETKANSATAMRGGWVGGWGGDTTNKFKMVWSLPIMSECLFGLCMQRDVCMLAGLCMHVFMFNQPSGTGWW